VTAMGHSGTIAWFARNPVAANLLMLIIVVAGLSAAFRIQRAMLPTFEVELIFITVVYPGAAPEEVERGVTLKIEEAINDLDGIKRVESDSLESYARLMVEPQDGFDLGKLLDELQNRIDGIVNFPEEAEKPIVSQPELLFPALTLQVSGDIGERGLKALADDIRRELLTYPEVSSAEVVGARDYEISIEIPEQILREYHLSLGDVARTIAASSLDLPAGSVQTANGDIMLRTLGQAYVQRDFETIPVKTWPDGTRLLLGDIATVDDGFVDQRGFAQFDGHYSLGINVFAMGSQDILDTAAAVRGYMEEKRHSLPDGVTLDAWSDVTYYLQGRLGMMFKNLAIGALLVFIVLALFLEIKLAFWVMLGIPISFLGAMALISTPYIHATLNMISIFGFILVLGIVVDDAIVIGESAYAEQERRGPGLQTVIDGAYRVAIPATFGVLTTIAAFLPTLFVQGVFGAFPAACGWVVLLCLCFSLLESKWILPAHLAHSKPTRNRLLLAVDRVQERVNHGLRNFIEYRYRPFMVRCVENRYITLGAFLATGILCSGLVLGGVVRTVLAPDVRGEFISAELQMAEGTPEERTLQTIEWLVTSLEEVERDYQRERGTDEKLLAHVAAYGSGRINGRVEVELTGNDRRDLSTRDIERRWRDRIGTVHGARVLAISSENGPSFGPDVAFDLIHDDLSTLRAASAELEEELRRYTGLYDFRNGIGDTADEFHLDILPEAESLGLTRYDLGSQVRHAFYGAEAQRIQRGNDEIKVLVRYPRADRELASSLQNMYIRTPAGDGVPFDTVAKLDISQGLLKTTRINFRRASEVTAQADKELVEPAKVIEEIERNFMPGLLARYPGLRYGISGMADEEKLVAVSMLWGFILSLFGIYALLAVPTRSYLQPLVIMGAIPFGIIGAVVGHWIMGMALSMMSVMGIVALSGVVVNDSLLLVDHANRAVAEGGDRYPAVVDACTRRFRAIILTSATTFIGLAPILLERSTQAQEIIPMAVSLAFGILFATAITLLLVPSLYMVLDDLARWRTRWRAGEPAAMPPPAAHDHPAGGV